jgi:hypothetical protein
MPSASAKEAGERPSFSMIVRIRVTTSSIVPKVAEHSNVNRESRLNF